MIEEIKSYDKNFNEELFISNTDHIFIMLLDAIMDNDITNVKHFLSDEVFNNYSKLIEEYKSKNLTRLFDEMNVKTSRIDNYSIEGNKININVTIFARYMDYFVNENGQYVSGTNDRRIETTHHLTLTKDINSEGLKESRTCPNCGSNVDINASGICPYCNKVIDLNNKEYIVTKIDLI